MPLAASHHIARPALCALVAILLLLTAAPLAPAHPGHDSHDEAISLALAGGSTVVADQLQADAALMDRQMQRAEAQAPTARGGACISTVQVPGQGPSCLRADGSWQIPQAGPDLVTHGGDNPVDASYVILRMNAAMEAELAAADKSDITCATDPSTPRYQAIYAYPSTESYDPAHVQTMQKEIYKASAFINLSTQMDDPTRTLKLPMACDESGNVQVAVHQLPTAGSADSFSTVSSDLRALGYTSGSAPARRYIVYYDSVVGGGTYGWGGQGQFYSDSSNSADNLSNTSTGTYAINYHAYVGRPDWLMILHETLHTMGAVQNDAPQTTGGAHCRTDADIMCYADGGPTGQSTYEVAECYYTQLDCGRDSYFNAATPATDSYLATHWNVASPYNRFLAQTTGGEAQELIDVTRPSMPGSLALAESTMNSLSISWQASSDDTGVSAYRVSRSLGGSFSLVAQTTDLNYTLGGLNPGTWVTFRVTAVDAAGNESSYAQLMVRTASDTQAPTVPSDLTLLERTPYSLTLAWTASTDNVAVTSYSILLSMGTNQGWASVGTVTSGLQAPMFTLTGLQPGTNYSVTVAAFDAQNNNSGYIPSMTFATETIPVDTLAPAPPELASVNAGLAFATIVWSSPDPDAQYFRVQRQLTDGTTTSGTVTSNRQLTISGLQPGTSYRYLIWSFDQAGNRSLTAAVATFKTAEDTTTPTDDGSGSQDRVISQDSTKPTKPLRVRTVRRGHNFVILAWRPSADNVAVRGYRLYAKTGRRYRLIRVVRGSRVRLSGLRPHRSYKLAIEAFDAAGNRSARAFARARTR